MGKLYEILTNDSFFRALLLGSIIGIDSWRLYLIFRNILMLRDMPDVPLEIDVDPVVYDKMQMLTQYESERHLLITIIELNVKVAKLVFNYFPYVWMLTDDYGHDYGDRLVVRAMLFSAVDNSLEVAVAIPLIFLSSLLTGVGSPILLALDQILDIVFRSIVSAIGTYGIIYVTDKLGVPSILIGNLILNGLGILFMALYFGFMMPFNYARLPENETGRSVKALAKEVGYPTQSIFVDKTAREPNAFYSSAIFSNTIIINEPLLKTLDANQVTSVVAHELAHWAYYHSICTSLGQTAEVVALGCLWIYSYGSTKLISVFQIAPDAQPFIPAYIAIYFIWLPFRELFQGTFNIFKTYLEFVADDYACSLLSSNNLRQALVKISLKMSSFPLLDKWFSAWFIGHPSILQRIRRIDSNYGI